LPAKAAVPGVVIAASTSPNILFFIMLALVMFVAIAALVFWQQWRTPPVEHTDDAA
jgi:hypothetical protein